MAKQYNYNSFENLAGGLNEHISDVQLYNNDAIEAKNVIFDRYGAYGKIKKRQGLVRANTVALNGKVKGIVPFTLSDKAYLQYYTEQAGNGYMYNAALDASGDPTGSYTAVMTTLANTVTPYFDILDDTLFGTFKDNSTLKDNFSAIITASASTPWKGIQAIVLSSELAITNETTFYTSGDSSYKTFTTSATFDSFEGFVATYSAAGYSVADQIISVDLMVESSLRDQNESDTYSDDYNPSIIRVVLYNMETDGSFTNGASYSFTKPSDSAQIFSQSFGNYSVDPASTTDEKGWTYSAFGAGFDTSKPLGKFLAGFNLGGVTDDDESGGEDVSIWIDNLQLRERYSGLMAFNGTSWDKILDTAVPQDPSGVIEFDGRLWVSSKNNIYASYPLDGSNFKDGLSFSISKGDGDTVTVMRKLGDQLIAFKESSITRISPSNSSSIPYIAKTIYSGDVSQKGIGCVAGKTAKNVILGTSNDDYLGALEYIAFLSHNGIYALGSTGAPTLISKRVKETLNDYSVDKSNCFAALSPEESLYMLALTNTSAESSEQIVYGSLSKAYSIFDFADITAMSEISADNKAYSLIGDKNGFIYKYAHFTASALSNYRDELYDGSFAAIDAIYQGKYNNFGNQGKALQANSMELGVAPQATDCPMAYNIYNEVGNSISGSVSTLNTTITQDVYIKQVTTKLFGRYLSYKFSNSVLSQDMVLYFWKPGIFLLGA